MPIDLETFRQLTLEDPEGNWQLICRRLTGKPKPTEVHRRTIAGLHAQLQTLAPAGTHVCVDAVYLLAGSEHRLIPDVAAITADIIGGVHEQIGGRPAVEAPVSLVVELWSAEIDGHDFDTKIWQYQARGDQEIWRIHPFDRDVTIWRRQPDGSYSEEIRRGGTVQPVALRGATIDLDDLFA